MRSLGVAAADPLRRDDHVQRAREADGTLRRRPRGGRRQRAKPHPDRHPVPPGRRGRRFPDRLRRRPRRQAAPALPRGAVSRAEPRAPPGTSSISRVRPPRNSRSSIRSAARRRVDRAGGLLHHPSVRHQNEQEPTEECAVPGQLGMPRRPVGCRARGARSAEPRGGDHGDARVLAPGSGAGGDHGVLDGKGRRSLRRGLVPVSGARGGRELPHDPRLRSPGYPGLDGARRGDLGDRGRRPRAKRRRDRDGAVPLRDPEPRAGRPARRQPDLASAGLPLQRSGLRRRDRSGRDPVGRRRDPNHALETLLPGPELQYLRRGSRAGGGLLRVDRRGSGAGDLVRNARVLHGRDPLPRPRPAHGRRSVPGNGHAGGPPPGGHRQALGRDRSLRTGPLVRTLRHPST